jgi:hypothetical protein
MPVIAFAADDHALPYARYIELAAVAQVDAVGGEHPRKGR